MTCPVAAAIGTIPSFRKRRPKTPAKAYDTAAASTANCASTSAPSPLNAPGPMVTTTPTIPISTPASRFPVIRSSLVKTCATITVNSGVVALRIAARPEAMWVCPQTIRQNGIALLSSPIPKKAAQAERSRGR